MKRKAGSDPKPSNSSTTGKKRRTIPSPAGNVSVFSNAQNPQITDSSFIINTTTVNESTALNPLYDRVAPNAILNSGGRADEVRCYPGTREEVIGLIDKWRVDIENGVTANQLFWLSGPAGAGKTAIVQTVAETWKALGVHTANFFFFRTDSSRSHARALISTLLYQIFDFCPAAREVVSRTLSLKPRILDAGLEEQFHELICNTFRSIQSSFSHGIILLIDGLDECDSEDKISQRQILRALDKIVGQTGLRFLVLVSSRAEVHISDSFNRLTSKAHSIFLDDQYSPGADIRLFVVAEFENIKKFHPHASLLESAWPSNSDIDAIVKKSSGQFIYAATVMRFITHSSTVPSLSLERVHNIVPPPKNSPFAFLDAFYTYILKQADDDEAVRDVLSAKLLDDSLSRPEKARRTYTRTDWRPLPSYQYVTPISGFLRICNPRYTETVVASCISDISSIVQFRNGNINFYHASLTDFLHQPLRSAGFYIDLGAFVMKVLPAVWKHGRFLLNESSIPAALRILNLVPGTTPEITDALLTIQPSHVAGGFPRSPAPMVFLESIFRLYYTADIGSYKKILRFWITEPAFDFYPSDLIRIPFASRYLNGGEDEDEDDEDEDEDHEDDDEDHEEEDDEDDDEDDDEGDEEDDTEDDTEDDKEDDQEEDDNLVYVACR